MEIVPNKSLSLCLSLCPQDCVCSAGGRVEHERKKEKKERQRAEEGEEREEEEEEEEEEDEFRAETRNVA